MFIYSLENNTYYVRELLRLQNIILLWFFSCGNQETTTIFRRLLAINFKLFFKFVLKCKNHFMSQVIATLVLATNRAGFRIAGEGSWFNVEGGSCVGFQIL